MKSDYFTIACILAAASTSSIVSAGKASLADLKAMVKEA